MKLFLELQLNDENKPLNTDLVILLELIKKIVDNKPQFRCHLCGFSGKTLHWQCPGCKHWGSVNPVSVEVEKELDYAY